MKKLLLSLSILLMATSAFCQDTEKECIYGGVGGYHYPTDPLVQEKLAHWQDLKFGVIFHWGLYSVSGVDMVESWTLCSEDLDWITRDTTMTYDEYKKWYFDQSKNFYPDKFDPEKWADIMADAGFKFMYTTTKHHDGFCMYDSKYTDFKITNGIFGSNPKADVTKHIVDAFRAKDFMIGLYFSKPDWHSEYYWNPYFATGDRNHNYDVNKHPEWWKKYQEYVANQMDEITSNYGNIDMLWIDGGWLPASMVNLDEIIDKARAKNPGMLSADRYGGKNEDFQTPELYIPDGQYNYPWECSFNLNGMWAYVPDRPYSSWQTLVCNLAEITAKGGNMMVGIGPTKEGEIHPDAEKVLREMGVWMRANGEAIYGTTTTPHYRDGKDNNIWFNSSKDHKTLYAIFAIDEKGTVPATIEWSENIPVGKMTMVSTGKTVKYTVKDGKVTVNVPKGTEGPFALKFNVSK